MAGDVMVEAWIESHDDTAWLSTDYGSDTNGALRGALAPGYDGISSEEIDDLVGQTLAVLPADEAFDLGRFVSSIGHAVAPIAQQVIPVAAPLIGTAIGGPVGGMIGGAVGQMVGGRPPAMPTRPPVAVTSPPIGVTMMPAPPGPGVPIPYPTAIATPTPAGPVPNAMPAIPTAPVAPVAPIATPAPAPLASALSGLVALLQSSALGQSIVGQLLGGAGAKTVNVGANNVPVSFQTIMNALASLATQAANASTDAHGEASEAESTLYLRDASGGYAYDPAVPEERASALIAHLRSGEAVESGGDSVGDWLARAGLVR